MVGVGHWLNKATTEVYKKEREQHILRACKGGGAKTAKLEMALRGCCVSARSSDTRKATAETSLRARAPGRRRARCVRQCGCPPLAPGARRRTQPGGRTRGPFPRRHHPVARPAAAAPPPVQGQHRGCPRMSGQGSDMCGHVWPQSDGR